MTATLDHLVCYTAAYDVNGDQCDWDARAFYIQRTDIQGASGTFLYVDGSTPREFDDHQSALEAGGAAVKPKPELLHQWESRGFIHKIYTSGRHTKETYRGHTIITDSMPDYFDALEAAGHLRKNGDGTWSKVPTAAAALDDAETFTLYLDGLGSPCSRAARVGWIVKRCPGQYWFSRADGSVSTESNSLAGIWNIAMRELIGF